MAYENIYGMLVNALYNVNYVSGDNSRIAAEFFQ